MPLPSIPETSEFTEDLQPVIHLPADNKPTNAVIFLPGLGDTSTNFANFAKALNLPDVVTITLQPPFPLPFPLNPGYQWSEDLQVDTTTGDLDQDSPLTKASDILVDHVIKRILIEKHHFSPAAIHLFGFGQGGSLALTVPLHPHLADLPQGLGGVVSIGGTVPLSINHAVTTKARTPICLLGGSKGQLTKNDQSAVKRLKTLFEFVEYHQWKKPDDSMPKNRDETLPMMQFFARRLRDRRGVPDDFVEVG